MTEYIRIDDDFEPEIVEEEIIWLSDEQFELEDSLFQQLSAPGAFEFHLILGVAGTGKTQVLLSLADDLREAGHSVVLGISQSLKKSLTDAGFQIKSDIPGFGSIHLIDDPAKVSDIKKAYETAKMLRARALVISIDPFQWTERKALMKFAAYLRPEMGEQAFIASHETLTKFRDVAYGTNPKVHWLRTVFRQSKRVGSQALELSRYIFGQMNPNVYDHKKQEFESFTQPFVEGLLVDVSFEKDGGGFDVFEAQDSTGQLWKLISEHVSRNDRWSWTDSLLVVPQIQQLESKWSDYEVPIKGLSDQPDFNPDIQLSEIFSKLRIRFALYDFPTTVRGEQFQDVIVAVSKPLWAHFHRPKSGLGSQEWAQIMPLHTYITRAKDRVQIVVGPTPSTNAS